VPGRHAPTERTCVVTRQTLPVDALIRFVVAPDGTVVADLRRRLPGRGVWVTADAGHVATAERKGLLARAFDGPARVEPGLADRVEGLLKAAAAAALSLARKAGTVVGGYSKVEAALAREPMVGLIHAAEAGADGAAKLDSAARRRFGEGGLAIIRSLTTEDLDLAFGRTNVIHAALLAGPASTNLLARIRDLDRFRGNRAPHGAGGRQFDALEDTSTLPAGH
jgi:predicted RNA-binding protein YlxR (DUF448 family)